MNIFKLKGEERRLALATLVVVASLVGMMTAQYSPLFLKGGNLGYWTLFSRNFRMSGYDCWSYITLSNLRIHFETMRHPLFFPILYPLYWLNQWLMQLTGQNYAVYIMGTLTTFCAVYAMVFVYRLHHEIVGLKKTDALLLTVFFYSLGHVMVAMMVPDHFVISLFLLTLTLYVVCRALKNGQALAWWKWSLLLFLTAGVTLTNGAKTLLAARHAEGRRVFRWQMVSGAVLVFGLLGAIYAWQYRIFEVPQQAAIHKIEKGLKEKKGAEVTRHNAERARWVEAHRGKPVSDLPLLNLTDVTTPRLPTVVHNLFGESVQLHRDYLLQDMAFTRPVFVGYRSPLNYVVEALVVLLFAAGLWVGRRTHPAQLCLWWMLVDAGLHLVLGFGINEIYIMSADWIFAIPLALAFLLKHTQGRLQLGLRVVSVALTLYLLVWNGRLLISYLQVPYQSLVK